MHFVDKFRAEKQKDIAGLSDAVLKMLMRHSFPGNIRELENILLRAVALTKGNNILTSESIQLPDSQETDLPGKTNGPVTLADAEKLHIEKMLIGNEWNISKTARLLDISPTTLRKKISDFNLSYN